MTTTLEHKQRVLRHLEGRAVRATIDELEAEVDRCETALRDANQALFDARVAVLREELAKEVR